MITIFENTLNSISAEYFGLTERVFTYELYHKLRFRNIPHEIGLLHANIVIDAELPKRVLTVQHAAELGLLPLENLMSPDIIIHERDTGNQQLLVAEIKAEKYLNGLKTIHDINKLISLRRNYNFQLGIFVAINVNMNRICQHILDNQNVIMWPLDGGQAQVDPNLDIHIFTKLNSASNWEHETLINILQNETEL